MFPYFRVLITDTFLIRVLLVLIAGGLLCPSRGLAAAPSTPELIPQGNFLGNGMGVLPAGWRLGGPRASLAPVFRVVKKDGRRMLHVAGGGNPDCIGWLATTVKLERGKTYWFRTRFQRSPALLPLHQLRFQVVSREGTQNMVEFHRLEGEWVEGEARILYPGEGLLEVEARIVLQLCADGEAWIEKVSLCETAPLGPRWVRIGCTQGPSRLEEYGLKVFSRALDAAGEQKADLFLLPEYMNGEITTETLSGPSARLMSEKARQYRMYVAGTIGCQDPATGRLTNAALLFDRQGQLIGRYDKLHLYLPELHDYGVVPGENALAFATDFGHVAFMTCYDSLFPDVAELAALRGADILLFPNLGYDRRLMFARAADNGVFLVTSTRSGKYGVWTPSGLDIAEATSKSNPVEAYKDMVQLTRDELGILFVSVDLNECANLEWRGGTRCPIPRGKRHSANQRVWLEREIEREKLRWWTE